jgi:hypothetical protein
MKPFIDSFLRLHDPTYLNAAMLFAAPESILGRHLKEKGPDGIDISSH